jgi:DNA/RNA-binding domain of Phe-tRNA-synthetase-like protein
MLIDVSEKWKSAYPGAAVGVLAMGGVANPKTHPGLEQRKRTLERELRARYSGFDREAIKRIPVMAAYNNYYRLFKKTYHLQLQLESLVLQDRSIPSVAALVEVMFMAELKNLLLTAGHDLEVVESPLHIDIADGEMRYRQMNGKQAAPKAGDMVIMDAEGIISSIIYGPDQRTRIRPETKQVLFTVYAPDGIGDQSVHAHLEDIRENVSLVSPGAEVVGLEVHLAV